MKTFRREFRGHPRSTEFAMKEKKNRQNPESWNIQNEQAVGEIKAAFQETQKQPLGKYAMQARSKP